MDHKLWNWNKRSSEKTIIANEPVQIRDPRCYTEVSEKTPALIMADCHAKDELGTKYERMAQNMLAEPEKAEVREPLIKWELDEALTLKAAADERLSPIQGALENSMDQLNALKHEMEGKIRDAVVKATTMFVERQVEFEEKLNEATMDFANLSVENSQLITEISMKNKVIEDLDRRKCEAELELDTLMERLDGIEKENAFLKYEFYLMEKELATRNEELEYCIQSTEALHKKHLQSLRKITKLETECQRLRVQKQKQLPQSAITRTPTARQNCLMGQLRNLEHENKMLKEIIVIKDIKLKQMCGNVSSDNPCLELTRYENSICNEGSSSSESWANALILELENVRNGELQSSLSRRFDRVPMFPGSDFSDREKLAIVPLEITPHSGAKLDDRSTISSFDWLQVVLDAMMEQHRISKQDLRDLLRDVCIALGFVNSCGDAPSRTRQSSMSSNDDESYNHMISGLLPWEAPPITGVGNSKEIKNMEMANKELEERLEDARQEISRMKCEVDNLKESKRLLEDQTEHQKSINEDLDTQHAVAKAKLNEVMQKFFSLEIELEDRNNFCEELESTCLELQLQLESVARGPLKYGLVQEPMLSQTFQGWEVKLAECEETVLNLGMQLKALSSPREALDFSRATSDGSAVIASQRTRKPNDRSSLRDRMLADGFSELKGMVAPQYTKIPSPTSDALVISRAVVRAPEAGHATAEKKVVGSLAIASTYRKGGGFDFVKKLLIKGNTERKRS